MPLGFKEEDFNLNRQQLEALLKWLHSDTEKAGQIYNKILDRLQTYFRCNGCNHSQECAAVVMNRIAKKIHEGIRAEKEPISYAIGFAKFILLEYRRWQSTSQEITKPEISEPPPGEERENPEKEKCWEKCLRAFPYEKIQLLKDYLSANRKQKLEIAKNLNTTIESLRVKISRIKEALKRCEGDCLRGLQMA